MITINNKKLAALFVIIAAATGALYMSARGIMIAGNTWLYIIESNITLNFILFLALYGAACDKYTKHKSKRDQWLIFVIGFVIIVAFFRIVGGFPTVFG